jgi:hypothetical protein
MLAHLLPNLSDDQVFPPNVRYYHISSSQHTPNTNSTINPTRQLPSNPANHGHVIFGLIVALDRWVTRDVEPPPSTLPRLADGTMGDWRREASGFPSIPGVNYPPWIHEPPIFDLTTIENGVLTEVPIPFLAFYPAYAPTVDADGNEIPGIRIPDIQCPIGTHTGWALRTATFNGEGTPIRNGGSFIPFARTRAERLAAGDPRLSLEERYRNHAQYVRCVRQAARELRKQDFILPEAVDDYVRRAEERNVP